MQLLLLLLLLQRPLPLLTLAAALQWLCRGTLLGPAWSAMEAQRLRLLQLQQRLLQLGFLVLASWAEQQSQQMLGTAECPLSMREGLLQLRTAQTLLLLFQLRPGMMCLLLSCYLLCPSELVMLGCLHPCPVLLLQQGHACLHLPAIVLLCPQLLWQHLLMWVHPVLALVRLWQLQGCGGHQQVQTCELWGTIHLSPAPGKNHSLCLLLLALGFLCSALLL